MSMIKKDFKSILFLQIISGQININNVKLNINKLYFIMMYLVFVDNAFVNQCWCFLIIHIFYTISNGNYAIGDVNSGIKKKSFIFWQ